MQRPPPYNWLFVFKVTVESGSFTKASENLNVSQSAVSQQVKSLEEYLGKSLIIREKKGLKLTDVGKHYYNIIKTSLDNISSATNSLFKDKDKDKVTINCNYSFMESWLSRNIWEFQKNNNDIDLEIHTAHWITDQESIGQHITIIYDSDPVGNFTYYKLTEETIFPVCSPRLISKISDIGCILDHPLISVMGNKFGWDMWFKTNNLEFKSTHNTLYLDSSMLAYNIAASGDYIALGIKSMVEPFLQSGQLVEIPSTEIKNKEDFYIIEPDSINISESERKFCTWIKSKLNKANHS